MIFNLFLNRRILLRLGDSPLDIVRPDWLGKNPQASFYKYGDHISTRDVIILPFHFPHYMVNIVFKCNFQE